jgi:acyl-CoA thioester hydrolase
LSATPDVTRLAAYPHRIAHAIRYGDTDRQGHVNNAAYATYFEHGRTLLFVDPATRLLAPGTEPVLVRLAIDYRSELHWPGDVTIATAVLALGTTSMRLAQAVFLGETCAASGEAVVVQLDSATRKPRPWNEPQKLGMAAWMLVSTGF